MKKNNFMGKKLLSLLLVISLISCALSYSLVVSAADLGTGGQSNGETSITYNVEKVYSVTIPASHTAGTIAENTTTEVGKLTATETLKVNPGARIDHDEKLNVSITGEGEDGAFIFKNNAAGATKSFAAAVKVNNQDYTGGNNAISAAAGSGTGEYAYNGVTKEIEVKNSEDITMSGTFTCKLTFAVAAVKQ